MTRKSNGRPPIYPWDKWLHGKPTIIRPGKDFQCTQKSMCINIRVRSAYRRLQVSVYPNKDDGSILIVPRGLRDEQ